MTKWCIALAFTAAAVSFGAVQHPAEVYADDIGPRIGDVAPDFEAPDQHGVTRRLSTLLGPKGAMLVFYRSAEW